MAQTHMLKLEVEFYPNPGRMTQTHDGGGSLLVQPGSAIETIDQSPEGLVESKMDSSH